MIILFITLVIFILALVANMCYRRYKLRRFYRSIDALKRRPK